MTLDGFLIAYGSALILPAAVIEGPVVSIISGVLSAQGSSIGTGRCVCWCVAT